MFLSKLESNKLLLKENCLGILKGKIMIDLDYFIDKIKNGPYYPENNYSSSFNEEDLFNLHSILSTIIVRDIDFMGTSFRKILIKLVLNLQNLLDDIDESRNKPGYAIYSMPVQLLRFPVKYRDWIKRKNKERK